MFVAELKKNTIPYTIIIRNTKQNTRPRRGCRRAPEEDPENGSLGHHGLPDGDVEHLLRERQAEGLVGVLEALVEAVGQRAHAEHTE